MAAELFLDKEKDRGDVGRRMAEQRAEKEWRWAGERLGVAEEEEEEEEEAAAAVGSFKQKRTPIESERKLSQSTGFVRLLSIRIESICLFWDNVDALR